jgi:predicted PurR-regulated permease PerM
MTTTPDPAASLVEAAQRFEELREKRREERHETDRLVRVVFYGTVLLVAWLMWRVVQPFAMEIGWALVLAICLNPIRNRLTPRLGATKAAFVITLAVLFLVILPLVFVGHTLYNEGATSVSYVQQKLDDQGGPAMLFHRIWDWARSRAPLLPAEEVVLSEISSSVGRILEFVAHRAGRIIAGIAGFAFSLVIMLSILFFLLRDSPSFARALRRVMPFEPDLNERFMDLSEDLVSASVTTMLANAAVQGTIGAVAFLLLGVPGAILWAFIMTILSFLPIVGSALVWVPVSIWLALSGHLVRGVVLLLIGLLILGNVENVIRPLLLAGKSKLNTLVLIISLLGGVRAFGFIGVVLGPLVAVMLTAIIESYASRPDGELYVAAEAAPAPLAAPSAKPAAVLPAGPVATTLAEPE